MAVVEACCVGQQAGTGAAVGGGCLVVRTPDSSMVRPRVCWLAISSSCSGWVLGLSMLVSRARCRRGVCVGAC